MGIKYVGQVARVGEISFRNIMERDKLENLGSGGRIVLSLCK
jgi:hypothetical protein